jgi:alpha-L-fucosidase 2
MRYKRIYITISFVLVVLVGFAQTQELKLWYSRPAVKWVEALPIGNGRLGAMIFGGVVKDRIQFNEETLWTGEPRNYNHEGAAKYLPEIRRLLFEGRQKEAEALAEEKFMGSKSGEGKKAAWFAAMRSLKGMKGDPSKVDYDDAAWKTMQVPSYEGWETIGFEGLDGAVWFRTTFELPSNWGGKDMVLDLNRIRDQDFTYINGKLVGSTDSASARKYIISKDVLRAGKNVIAIQVLNYFDKGGIAGYKDTSKHIGIYPVGDELNKLSLNGSWKYNIQNDEPPAAPRYQADYQPFGDVYLNFASHTNFSNYTRSLDIANAVSKTTYTNNGTTYTREYLATEPGQAIVIHLTVDKPSSISFDVDLNSPHKYSATKMFDATTLNLSVKVKNGALKGEAFLKVVVANGNAYIKDNKLFVSNADEATLYLTAATNYKSYKDVSADAAAIAKKDLSALQNQTYGQLKNAHVAAYKKYFNTFSIELNGSENALLPTDERLKKFATSNDASFAALYVQYGRYLLISSSRPGTRPANLQGIWNELLSPPWGSKYTTNINAEMNYWPAELLNLSPMHEPLFKMIEELAQAGKQTAKVHYDARGWALHHNTDLWRGTAPINAANHGIWVTGGAWLCDHLWQHYLFTKDENFLRSRAYPIMKDAALFFNDFLIKDPKTSLLISAPSNSPEHGGLVAGPSMDHQIIRALFRNVITASTLLHTDNALRDTLQQKLAQIAPDHIGKHGQLQEWLEDKDDPNDKHRHVSHLWAVYPGSEINWDEKPTFMKAAQESLIERGDAATGWSLGWKINLWARFKDGDHSYKLLQMLLSPVAGGAGSYPNLFDAHPPFQIDGNFGGSAGIGEMLVQSHTKYLDLLPALPTAFATGNVHGIGARGGFQLNMKWANGKLVQVQILSKAGANCLLRYGTKTISFKTTKGKTYTLNGELKLL